MLPRQRLACGRPITLGWLVALALVASSAHAAALEILTGNIPPFSIEQGDKPGFVREIVAAIAKDIGVEPKVTYMNWPQAQELAKTQRDTLIFPLARTSTREPHYTWVQKIIDMDVLFATAPGKPPVESEEAAKRLTRIGVREGSPMVRDLQGRGFTNLVIVKAPSDNAKALVAGEIDAWYAPAPEIGFNWRQLDLPGVPAWGAKLDTVPLYVAASQNSPGIDIEKWRAAFARLKAEGVIDRILADYLPR